MVGNRLKRDVRGANGLGLISVLMRHNDRYPDDARRATDGASRATR